MSIPIGVSEGAGSLGMHFVPQYFLPYPQTHLTIWSPNHSRAMGCGHITWVQGGVYISTIPLRPVMVGNSSHNRLFKSELCPSRLCVLVQGTYPPWLPMVVRGPGGAYVRQSRLCSVPQGSDGYNVLACHHQCLNMCVKGWKMEYSVKLFVVL